MVVEQTVLQRAFGLSCLRCVWLVALVVVLLLAGLVTGAAPETENDSLKIPHPDFRTATVGKVLRVVRGETVIVRVAEEGRRIALIGVTAQPLTQPAGREAKRFLENLLKGESVYVEYAQEEPQVDQFGRYPAYLYRAPDGLFVNLELVRQGYTGVADEQEFKYRLVFEKFEQRARQARKGQWGPPARLETTTTAAAPLVPLPAVEKSEEKDRDDPIDGVVVYITKQGKKYHRADCYHLRKSGIPLELGEALRRGYAPCAHCKPPK